MLHSTFQSMMAFYGPWLRGLGLIKILQLKELYSFLPTTGSPKALAVRASLKTVSSALKDLGEQKVNFVKLKRHSLTSQFLK